ncbi:hypothetical protein NB689_002798 [Xanthomonas sacchari]|nr:hypothetical protein [Xanthomonas sacchari]
MHDPLRACREELQRLYDTLPPPDPQRVLFDV